MKFSNMPALFALTAGLVVSITTLCSGRDTLQSLIWVLVAILIFYILGVALKVLFNVILLEVTVEEKEIISEEETVTTVEQKV